MKKHIISLLLLLSAISPSFAVSFDCEQTHKTVLQLICKSPELSKLDDELMAYYQRLKGQAAQLGPAEQSFFQNLVKEGLKSRELCQDEACLIEWYQRYIDIYSQAGNAFKQAEQKNPTQATFPSAFPETTHVIDEEATAKARWSIGQIVATGTLSWGGTYHGMPVYRKFLGITKEGYFLVQAFYKKNDKKYTDPYVLVSLGEVTSSNSIGSEDHISGQLVRWYPNGQKWFEGQYFNGEVYGIRRHWDDSGELNEEVNFDTGYIYVK